MSKIAPPPGEGPPKEAAFRVKPQAISLPKGGGALRGIGEKFAANPATGSGSITVPVFTSPGRSGHQPDLALTYDSASGNGPFGMGWRLSVASITRRTDRGLPRYLETSAPADARVPEPDVFLFAGQEDLVPVDGPDTNRTVYGKTYSIHAYRPRLEGLFARIERWTSTADAKDSFWRTISKDNQTAWYGKTAASRIADPEHAERIFSWLLCESYDGRGNIIVYEYKPEDTARVDLTEIHQRNRRQPSPNRYIKRIRYGNRDPYFPDLNAAAPAPLPTAWRFDVVFDYGEHDAAAPRPDVEAAEWARRDDPFSTYRSTFEIRTYRLCRRVLMFHHFPEEPDVLANCLVRSTDFRYSTPGADPSEPFYSVIESVTQTGYTRRPGGYLAKSLPKLEFEYTRAVIDETVRTVDPRSVENMPRGVGGEYTWVDLQGEGVSGVLTEQAGAWLYKPNLSPANSPGPGKPPSAPWFGPLETVPVRPATTALAEHGQQLLDLGGDGRPELVAFGGAVPGFYEAAGQTGKPFRPFRSLPRLNWEHPDLRFIDLTGDGISDVAQTEDGAIRWYRSLGERGFDEEQRIPWPVDEEKGPRLLFSDPSGCAFAADMSGDGLTDLVRVRPGEICYWPNLGYGRFGAKVAMANPPRFDGEEQFDPRRLRLADIDGAGTCDLIYLGTDGIRIYFNQGGERWREARVLREFPRADSVTSVEALDLMGDGTACLVWSAPLPGDAARPMRYIHLMGGHKPHLLSRVVNNLGGETRIEYAPSTRFYLQDKLAGRPWITRLPFPVHVVERVWTYDYIGRNLFATRYAYHHGYFDPREREFRGFGMVEQWDTEEFAALSNNPAFPAAANLDAASHSSQMRSKTWYHTGAFEEGDLTAAYRKEFFHEPGLNDEQAAAMRLPQSELPTALLRPDGSREEHRLTNEEVAEAWRALKGLVVRQEVYGLDGSDAEQRPYSATEHNYTIELLQARGANEHAVFLAWPREVVEWHYERKLYKVSGGMLDLDEPPAPASVDAFDPRVSHTVNLRVDIFGNVLDSVSIAYGRRYSNPELTPLDRNVQRKLLATWEQSTVTAARSGADDYRAPLAAEARTYELQGLEHPAPVAGATNLFAAGKLLAIVEGLEDGEHDVPYWDRNAAGRRLIERQRILYRPDDLGQSAGDVDALLPLGTAGLLALPGESYKLAIPAGLPQRIFRRGAVNLLPGPAAVLGSTDASGGGYVDLDRDGNWWIRSGRTYYSPNAAGAAAELTEARSNFFLPRRYTDEFGSTSVATYDTYDLATATVVDPIGNSISAEHDYRVLQPRALTDANGNRSFVRFDALGLVAGSAVCGKDGEAVGDSIDGFAADLTPAQVLAFQSAADPRVPGQALLGNASTRLVYDLDRHAQDRRDFPDDPTKWRPVFAATIARETHVADLVAGETSKLQVSFSYSDGLGHEVQRKELAEPPRWIGTGWRILNNKGKPVREYQPFFSDNHEFQFAAIVGVSSVMFYDAADRPVATVHPDGSYEKTVIEPWRHAAWDGNDTVTLDPRTDRDVGGLIAPYLATQPGWKTWLGRRAGHPASDPDAEAAAKTEVHAGTPAVAHFDPLGREFVSAAWNRFVRAGATVEEVLFSRATLDIEGNHIEARDASIQAGDEQGRIVVRTEFDMLGRRLHESGMDSGERWICPDADDKPVRAWNSRGFAFRYEYDGLRRLTRSFVQGGDPGNPGEQFFAAEIAFDRTIYGDSAETGLTLAERRKANLLGRPYRHQDPAGVVTTTYDFKGNPVAGARRFTADYKAFPDWSQAPEPALVAETFEYGSEFDALNRARTVTSPDGSVYAATFNDAGLLETVRVNLRGAPVWTTFVENIDYNAKGQRVAVKYGNGVESSYEYDAETFRLTRLRTTRAADADAIASLLFRSTGVAQDIRYTYDPAGNLTRVFDQALRTTMTGNQQVDPVCRYTYDALYRLTGATGREHIVQAAIDRDTGRRTCRDYPFAGWSAVNDLRAIRNYAETYEYDAAGNLRAMDHQAAAGSWTRGYVYGEASPIEAGKTNNRLSQTVLGAGAAPLTEPFGYDAHGNVTAMQHLPSMLWNFKDQMRASSRQVANVAAPQTTFYQYDSGGQRVRMVTELAGGGRNERLYIGSFETYREYRGGGLDLERETIHLMDDNERIALVETKTREGGVAQAAPAPLPRYQLGNHLGSNCLELDAAGALITYEEYSPFGATMFQAGRSAAELSLKRYRYTAKERDDENGFTYHGARYYAPWLGRWTSCDPAGLADGANVYAFVGNRPLMRIDESGRFGEEARRIIGQVKAHADQANPRKMFGAIVTESEHVISKGILKRLQHNPIAKASEYTEHSYQADTTVVLEREAALQKTYASRGGKFADSARRLAAKAKGGVVDLNTEVRAATKATHKALKATGSRVTVHEVNRATLGQLGNLFETDRLADTAKKLADIEKANPGLNAGEAVEKAAKSTSTASKLSKVAKYGGAAAKLKAFGKFAGPVGAAATVMSVGVKTAQASSMDTRSDDKATRMEKTFEKAEAYAEAGADLLTLAPGAVGTIAAGAQMQTLIAKTGIKHTGGDKRIVDAGKSAELFAKKRGASDVGAETAGATGSAISAIGEGAGIIGQFQMGPIGWAWLGVRYWKKF